MVRLFLAFFILIFSVGTGTANAVITLDPTSKGPYITLSAGNMKADHDGTSTQYWNGARATEGKASGKWYCEFLIGTGTNSYYALFGMVNTSATLSHVDNFIGFDANAWSRGALGPTKYHSGSQGTYGSYPANGNTIGIAVDMGAGKMWISTNGTWAGSPTAGTDPMFTGLTGTLYPACEIYSNTGSATFRATVDACVYDAPSGYSYYETPVYLISTSAGHILKAKELDAAGSAIDYMICNRATGAIVATGTSDAAGDFSEEVADGTTEHDIYIMDLTTDPPKAKVIAERVVGVVQ